MTDVRASRPTDAVRGMQEGEQAGKEAGYPIGYHIGRCEAVRNAVKPDIVSKRLLKVLFIPQGFPAIDQGIIRALQQLVSEVIVGANEEMLTLAEQHRPDVLLVLNGIHFFPKDHSEKADAIRRLGIRTAIWFADDPYCTDLSAVIAPHYDVVFTHELSCVSFYKELGCGEVYYLPLATDTDTFRPQPAPLLYHHDVCFIGMAFWNRVEQLEPIIGRLMKTKLIIAGGLWERMPSYSRLKAHVREGWVPIEETALYYSSAKIVINMHRAPSGDDNCNSRQLPALSVNPRTYEMAACASLQITDVRSDLSSLYTPGVDIETYSSPEELMDKINYYLQHEDERRRIAYNGLRTTLRRHTYLTRVDRLLAVLGFA